MRNLFAVLIVAVSFTLFSCNESRYPIDEKPEVKNDARLLGTWKITGKKDRAIYVLTSQTDNTYKITISEKNSQPEQYTAHLSSVKNNMFLNVEGKDEEGNKYVLLRILDINSKNDRARITSIADTTMHSLKSSKEVRALITAHLNDPKFYEDTLIFNRVK